MNLLSTIKQNLTLNRLVLFCFIIVYCGFYYSQYLSVISVSYLILFAAFAYNIVKWRRLFYGEFSLLIITFVLYSFVSSLWAYDPNKVYSSVLQLFKSTFVAFLVLQLIHDKKDFQVALFAFALGGLIYSLLYLQNVDINDLAGERISVMDDVEDMPNVNTVGLILSFSFVYFFFMLLYKRNLWNILFAAVSFVCVFLLGSRKSIISILIGVFLFLLKINMKSKVKVSLILFLFLLSALLIIPSDYMNFVLERLFGLFGGDKMDMILSGEAASDEMRMNLLQNGLLYFSDSPLLGHGYYSFSNLFYRDFGIYIYSHNNFIEELVGGGIIGFLLYYYLYKKIYDNLQIRKSGIDYIYLCFSLLFILLFNHIGIVLLHERFVWILLVILFAGSVLCKNECNENRLCSR